MVNLDWHDGYEEQEQAVGEFVNTHVRDTCQSVYNVIATGKNLPQECFVRLNESMRLVMDSWNDMLAIPARGGIGEYEEQMEAEIEFTAIGKFSKTYSSITDILTDVWKLVLLATCDSEECTDEEIFRYIKNYTDCVGNDLTNASFEEDELKKHKFYKNGKKELTNTTSKKKNGKSCLLS